MRKVADIERERAESERLRGDRPNTFVEAVSQYCALRKERLVIEMGDAESTFDARRCIHRVKALESILGAIDASMPKKKFKKDSRPDAASHLAQVLTPDGWEKKIQPKFEAIKDRAVDELLEEKNLDRNLAIVQETHRFLRHLAVTASAGRKADGRAKATTLRKATA